MSDLIERVEAARRFPTNTCGASRHAAQIGEALVRRWRYPMLTEEPAHCGESILATVASLWEARTEMERLTAALRVQPGPVSMDDVEWAGKAHLHDAQQEIERLRAAVQHEVDCVEAAKAEIERLTEENRRLRADLLAGRNVVNAGLTIHTLTAECDELRRRLAEAWAQREAMANVLPGYYYMDPPDGGDVSVLEQLRRMAKDAERYRFLSCKGVPPYFHRCSRWRLEYWNGEWWDPLMKEELDAAIDAQIEKERSDE